MCSRIHTGRRVAATHENDEEKENEKTCIEK